MPNSPTIYLHFSGDQVIWASAGWGDDTKLMRQAKCLINHGENRKEVIEFLTDVGFHVIETTPELIAYVQEHVKTT